MPCARALLIVLAAAAAAVMGAVAQPLVNTYRSVTISPHGRTSAPIAWTSDAESEFWVAGGVSDFDVPLGFDLSWIYNVAACEWRHVTPAGTRPRPRAHEFWGAVGTSVFLAGGVSSGTHSDVAPPAANFFTDGLFEYRLDLHEWRVYADVAMPRIVVPSDTGDGAALSGPARGIVSPSMAVHGSQVFVFGGFVMFRADGEATDRVVLSAALWSLDTAALTWRVVSPGGGPVARASAVLGALQDTLILVAGRGGAPFTRFADAWTLNFTTAAAQAGNGTWRLLASTLTSNRSIDPLGLNFTTETIPPFTDASSIVNPLDDVLVIFGGRSNFSTEADQIIVVNATMARGPSGMWKATTTSLKQLRFNIGAQGIIRHSSLFRRASRHMYVYFGADQQGAQVLHTGLRIEYPSMSTHSSLLCYPSARRNHVMYDFDECRIAVFAGKSATRLFLNDLWLLNMCTRKWELLSPQTEGASGPDLPGNRDEACLIRYLDTLYVLEGDIVDGVIGDRDRFWKFNLTSRQFSMLATIDEPTIPRFSQFCALDEANKQILMFGGGVSDILDNAVLALNLDTLVWTTLEPATRLAPAPRRNAFGTFWDGKMWIIGGSTENLVDNNVWSFDTNSRVWAVHPMTYEQGTSLPRIADYAIARHEHRVFVDINQNLYLYDLRAKAVTRLDPVLIPLDGATYLPRDRHAMGYVPATNTFIMYGGNGVAGHLHDLWEYSFNGFCSGRVERRSSSAQPVVSATDGSFANQYYPGSDCTFVLSDDIGVDVFLQQVALGANDYLEIYEGNATDSSKLLANFSGPVELSQTQLRQFKFSSSSAVLVRFRSDADEQTVGLGFMAVNARRCPPGTFASGLLRACTPCPKGEFNSDTGRAWCEVCPPGVFADTPGHVTCDVCGPGYKTVSPTECAPCGPGLFSNNTAGNSACVRCPTESYNTRDVATRCEVCPQHSWVGFLGSTNPLDCTCREGFYELKEQPNGDAPRGVVCLACPLGATCSGRDFLPVAKDGYFRIVQGTLQSVVTCLPSRACRNNTCAEGYEDVRCAVCSDGYTRHAQSGQCQKCQDRSGLRVLLFLIMIFLLMIVVGYFVYIFTHRELIRTVPAISIAIEFFQMIWLMSLLRIEWPSTLNYFFLLSDVISFNFNILQPGCVANTTYWYAWTIRITAPLFFIVAFALCLLIKYALQWWFPAHFLPAHLQRAGCDASRDAGFIRYTTERFANEWRFAVGALLFALYVGFAYVASTAFEIFSCVELENGDLVLRAEPSERCNSDNWKRARPLAILSVAAFVVLPLMYLAYRFWQSRDALRRIKRVHVSPGLPIVSEQQRLLALYGRFVLPYTSNQFYWSMVHQGKKFVMVLVVTFALNRLSYSGAITLCMLMVLMILDASLWPYRRLTNNIMQSVVNGVLFLFLLLGFLYFSTLTKDADRDAMTVVLGILYWSCAFAVSSNVIGEWFCRSRVTAPKRRAPSKPKPISAKASKTATASQDQVVDVAAAAISTGALVNGALSPANGGENGAHGPLPRSSSDASSLASSTPVNIELAVRSLKAAGAPQPQSQPQPQPQPPSQQQQAAAPELADGADSDADSASGDASFSASTSVGPLKRSGGSDAPAAVNGAGLAGPVEDDQKEVADHAADDLAGLSKQQLEAQVAALERQLSEARGRRSQRSQPRNAW